MIITIAGANSFIARRMIRILAAKKEYEVTAVVRAGSESRHLFAQNRNIKVVECNMEDYGRLGTLTGEGDIFINYSWNGTRGETRMDSTLQKSNYDYLKIIVPMPSVVKISKSNECFLRPSII